MPKNRKITADEIINASFEIVRAEGFQSFTTRNIAKKIGCSTQPIYYIYENIEVLKEKVNRKLADYMQQYIYSYKKSGVLFLDLGLGYIRFAKEEPVLFQEIYAGNLLHVNVTEMAADNTILEMVKKEFPEDLAPEQIQNMITKACVFTHGIASLVASNMIVYDEEKIENLLQNINHLNTP